MSFNGDLYPTAGASVVMTTSGDMVKYQSGARARLGIGSANQILQVKSSLPSWETVDLADTVLTTAGDVLYENATPELARLGAGTQYNTLQMGATSVLTTTGDLLYASAGNTLARLAGGTSGDVLTANGAGVAPSYQTAGGGLTINVQTQTTNVADGTTSLTFVDTVFTKTLSGTGAGTCNTVYNYTVENTNTYAVRWSYSVDGDQDEVQAVGPINYPHGTCYSAWTTTLTSQVCKVQMRMVVSGTVTMQPTSQYYSVGYWTELS